MSSTNNTVEETKTVFTSVLDSVVAGVQNVAHNVVETLQHGVEIAENVGHTVVDTTSEVVHNTVEAGKERAALITESLTETAGEILEAGKEKYALLTKQAVDKTEGVREVAGEYFEAGKEKAALLTKQAVEKTEGVREVMGEYIEAGKHMLGTTVPAKAEEIKEAAEETMSEVKDTTTEAVTGQKRKAEAAVETEADKLIKKTHGDEVDVTGHIVIAPEVREGKKSDYEGGWKTVGKDGHHSGGPHIVTGTPAK